MNGPEHYREAERLLAEVRKGYETGPTMSYEHESCSLAEAQVHATLAQVAATIDSRGYGAFEIRNNDAWEQVLGRPDAADCTDTSDCPSPVHDPACPATRGTR